MEKAAACLAVLLFAAGSARADSGVVHRWRTADAATQSAALGLAREAFDAYVERHVVIACPADLPPLLRERAGVFVSSMDERGAPRCCMGTLYPTQSDIAHEIIASAVAAAGHDRRFAPVTSALAHRIRLIVSIVAAPVPIASPEGLDPVADGLAAEAGGRFGVVLSGETRKRDRMIAWARIRAGGGAVRWFRIDDVRMIEAGGGSEHTSRP